MEVACKAKINFDRECKKAFATKSARSGCEQMQQTVALFNHLVGAGEQRGRHLDAERFGGLEIDHQLEFGWLHDRQIVRLLARENPAGVSSRRTKFVGEGRTIGD